MQQLTIQSGDVLEFSRVDVLDSARFCAVLTQDSAIFLDRILASVLRYGRILHLQGELLTHGTRFNVILSAIKQDVAANSPALLLRTYEV